MGKNRIDTSNPNTIERLMKEGRGFGDGENYVSWLKVQDVASLGRSHRIRGWRTGKRVVHLLSYLELQHFYTLEWDPRVVDYHEQFPLAMEMTKEIAGRMDIKHPMINGKRRSPDGKPMIVRGPIVMTTDILVLYKSEDGKPYREAHSVKPQAKLEGKQGPRIKEKLKLERAYWEQLDVKWRLVTDEPVGPEHGFPVDSLRVIDKVLVANMEWVHGYYYLEHFTSLTRQDAERVNDVLWPQVLEEQESLVGLCNRCDERLKLPVGASLTIAKHLIARRIWTADFSKPFHPCHPLAVSRN